MVIERTIGFHDAVIGMKQGAQRIATVSAHGARKDAANVFRFVRPINGYRLGGYDEFYCVSITESHDRVLPDEVGQTTNSAMSEVRSAVLRVSLVSSTYPLIRLVFDILSSYFLLPVTTLPPHPSIQYCSPTKPVIRNVPAP